MTLLKGAAYKQSHLQILILGDGMTYLCQVFAGSRYKVVLIDATALHTTRAVDERRSDQRRLPALISAFSRIKMISIKATAHHTTRAVNERRSDQRRLPAFIPAFSRIKVISINATAHHIARAVDERRCFIPRPYPNLTLKSPPPSRNLT